jgi:uncharacterized protein YcbX
MHRLSPNDPDALTACSPLTLAGLWFYPVKSCAGIALSAARIGPHGSIEGDREWAVVNTAGEATWQGEFPRMALIRPQLEAGWLTLHAPGIDPLRIARDAPRAACELKIWNEAKAGFDLVEAEDGGDEARRWFRAVLGGELSLMRQAPGAPTRPGLNPLHLISTASLDALNQQFPAAVEIERFRPNLLVAEADAGGISPFDEQRMDALLFETGAAAVTFHGACVRCVMPNIDLATAEVGVEPLASIARISEERERGSPAHFGAYGRSMPGTCFEVGMPLWGRLDF